jgi:alpha-D-ribose 1-methylphosphonate 5-triphosphate synthase subunit PhnG
MADALLQDPSRQSALEAGLLAPVRRQLERSQADRHARARSTRVEFFTVAREADGSQELGE